MVKIGEKYLSHKLFEDLEEYRTFYKSLSELVANRIPFGLKSMINIDTYVYSSMNGTLESIEVILKNGRINDAFSLLRKFYDSVIINLYTNLYLNENFGLDNFVVTKIDNWLKGTEKIPSFKEMSKYLTNSEKLKPITSLIYKSGKFKGSSFERIREMCNNHVHYLDYHTFLLNDNELIIERKKVFDNFHTSIISIIILHLSYLFYLNDHYMRSDDYTDYLDCGIPPEDGSENWVAPFIQDCFDKLIKSNRPDIAEVIKSNTALNLR